MLYRALRLTVVAGLVMFLFVAGRSENSAAVNDAGGGFSTNEMVTATYHLARAFPELRLPGLPTIQYLGAFSATGQFRGRSKWDRLQESLDQAVPCNDVSPCAVDSSMLRSDEREVRDYEFAHAVGTAESRPRLASLRDSTMTLTYGKARILRTPTYVAADSRHRVIVSDPEHALVHVLDPSSKHSFRIVGGKEYRLKSPAGVAVDGHDNIYIADNLRGIVLVYDQQGIFQRYLGSYRGENEFDGPASIAIDRVNERLYVADTPRNAVVELDLEGQRLGTFGAKRSRTGDVVFDRPSHVAVAKDGIVVLDDAGCRLQKLTLDGKPIYTRTLQKRARQEAHADDGLGVDAGGNIYVSSIPDSAIRVFSPGGELLGVFGQAGSLAGEFREPKGIFGDGSTSLYVADSQNNRVQVFRLASAR